MIPLPNEFQIQKDKDSELYFALIELLKSNAIKAKQILLETEFTQFPINGSQDDKAKFVRQFIPLLLNLILFPDEEVIQKLKSYQFASPTLKWMVNLDEITFEINRLIKIEGLYFPAYAYLIIIETHLSLKFHINFIENFVSTTYNNQDTSFLFVDFDKRIRRRDYHKKMNQTPKMDAFEKTMNEIFDDFEIITSEDADFSNKLLRQSAKGNTSYYLTLINKFSVQGMSRDKIYRELFPLLKLIIKDKELLSFDQFISTKDDKYNADYTNYQISRVKKILQKK